MVLRLGVTAAAEFEGEEVGSGQGGRWVRTL